jgi:hypothetical protein
MVSERIGLSDAKHIPAYPIIALFNWAINLIFVNINIEYLLAYLQNKSGEHV